MMGYKAGMSAKAVTSPVLVAVLIVSKNSSSGRRSLYADAGTGGARRLPARGTPEAAHSAHAAVYKRRRETLEAVAKTIERRRRAVRRSGATSSGSAIGAGDPIPIPGRADRVYPYQAHSEYFST